MSELLDGKLYEKKRIILPQHRKVIEQYEHGLDASHRKQPTISNQQYAEFSVLISEAVLNQSRIQITLFNKHGDEYIIGVPYVDGGLRIKTDEGTVEVPMKRVTDIRNI